jgi:protein-tyrosine phosphatase
VLSAGVSAYPGGPAADEAVEVAKQYGADLTGHRSRPLSPELAAQADLLVAMTREHVRSVLSAYRHLGAVPCLLCPAGDVADPIGQDRAVYEECAKQLWEHLEPLVGQMQ